MFGKDHEARETTRRLQEQLATMGDVNHRFSRLTDDVEMLTRRVRDLTSGNATGVLAREVIDKIDKDALVKEVAAILREDVSRRAKDMMEKALRDGDFLSERLEEDRIEEIVIKALVPKVKEMLSMDELVRKIAEELIEGDHLDLSEIETEIATAITDRAEITVNLDKKEDQ